MIGVVLSSISASVCVSVIALSVSSGAVATKLCNTSTSVNAASQSGTSGPSGDSGSVSLPMFVVTNSALVGIEIASGVESILKLTITGIIEGGSVWIGVDSVIAGGSVWIGVDSVIAGGSVWIGVDSVISGGSVWIGVDSVIAGGSVWIGVDSVIAGGSVWIGVDSVISGGSVWIGVDSVISGGSVWIGVDSVISGGSVWIGVDSVISGGSVWIGVDSVISGGSVWIGVDSVIAGGSVWIGVDSVIAGGSVRIGAIVVVGTLVSSGVSIADVRVAICGVVSVSGRGLASLAIANVLFAVNILSLTINVMSRRFPHTAHTRNLTSSCQPGFSVIVEPKYLNLCTCVSLSFFLTDLSAFNIPTAVVVTVTTRVTFLEYYSTLCLHFVTWS